MDEIRRAFRRLTKRPGATVASVVTLACAVGATAATWSLVSAVLISPLPVEDPERLFLVSLRSETSRGGRTSDSHTYRKYPAVRDAGVFDGLAAGGSPMPLMVATGGAPRTTEVFFASHDYFDTLGVRTAIGRGFSADEDVRGGPLVAVLSDRFWRTEFAASPDVLGRALTVQGHPVTVIGVAPRRFRGLELGRAPDLYMPLHAIEQVGDMFSWFEEPNPRASPVAFVRIVGRLPAAVSASQATERLQALAAGAAGNATFVLTPVVTAAIPETSRAGVQQFSRLLAATVGLLMLIGCLTVGMLQLIRTEARRDEFAMCLALGATRTHLARGVAVEGALLATVGALLSLPVSVGLFAGVRAFELPGRISLDLLDLSLDGRVLAAAASGAAAATVVVALVAGALGSTANIADVLRSRAGATPRLTRRPTRAFLVATQVAVAVVLVLGAGLFARSVMRALGLNAGFDTGRLVTGSVNLMAYGYGQDRARVFFDTLRARLEANPAFASVSLSYWPGGMGGGGKVEIDGEAREMPSFLAYASVDERHFSTIGQAVIRGRDFTRDDRPGSPLVAIVSESLGRFVAGGGDPIGHRVADFSNRPGERRDTIEIVGVVPNVVSNVREIEPLVLYQPLAQHAGGPPNRRITLRAAGDANDAIREAIGAIRQIDPAITPSTLLTMDRQILDQMGPQRFGMLVMGALGVIAVLLSALGTYVLAETMAAARRRELGIRAALGASRSQLGGLVVAETARLVGLGLAVGLALAWLGAETIRAFLFQIEPFDRATIGIVACLILAIAFAVTARPALQAARVDLARVLREE